MSYSSRSASAGPHRRPVTASEVRSVVFTTTRMRLGYDVEEVDSFLDQVEWSMEQMVSEITRLQRQISDIDRAHAASLEQARTTAHNLLLMLGGTPGGPRAVVTGVQPELPANQPQWVPPQQVPPRRAASTAPSVWSNPTPGSWPTGTVERAPLALSPPPTGQPAANLPPPPAAGPTAAGASWSFPPPRG